MATTSDTMPYCVHSRFIETIKETTYTWPHTTPIPLARA
jgi:hypothetical protein